VSNSTPPHLERLIHSVPETAVHPLDDVAVDAEGDAYAGVPEMLLDVLGMLACHEEYCSARTAQIMEPYGGETPVLAEDGSRRPRAPEMLPPKA
jgi:hypothetical protein